MRVWLLALLLSGCAAAPTQPDEPTQATAIDPAAPGALAHELVPWEAGLLLVEGSAGAYPVQLHGEATVPEGEGPFPVAILMHGRHTTCRYLPGTLGFEFLGHPCPEARPVLEPVDSYTGYRDLAGHLASHGILAISVSANDVNDYDNPEGARGDDYGATARGRIILAVIDAIAAGELPFSQKADLDRIGLMGHSRGGEGVVRAVLLDQQGPKHGIDAVMALAPTDFARWKLADVAFATILPYCDGDVSNLQGAWMYDDMAGGPKHQFLHMGANHNFYNSVWTGDDYGGTDPYCGPQQPDSGRLDAETQRAEGVVLMGAFLRHYLDVSPGLLPLLSGDAGLPTVHTSYVPGPLLAIWPNSHGTSLLSEGATFSRCAGPSCPSVRTYSLAEVERVEWDGEARLRVGLDQHDAGRMWIMRMTVDPETSSLSDLTVAFAGTDVQWPLEAGGAYLPPGDAMAKSVLSDVRFTVPDGATSAELHLRGQGAIQVQHWVVRDAACGSGCASP